MSKTNSLTITNFQQPLDVPTQEHKVLEYWDQDQTFQKSIDSKPKSKQFVFYDGPPFATGLPHYGHLLASTAKDVIPRYWTMKGYRVERVWGWDCHGIPIENIIEKELDLKGGKKGIEDYGIDKFNGACRSAILRFDKEWEKVIRRLARWVDFKNSYKTMDITYMESVWWAFKQLYDKGLVYEGRKVILYCPRCSTPLSNFEIAMDNSYKDIQDHSVYIKFPLKGKKNEYFLAWTTTPWTLIGNVGLAVKADANYVKARVGKEVLYLAKDKLAVLGETVTVEATLKGAKLEGLEYQPLYEYLDIGDKKAHYVATADFVTLDDGTGIVHTAAIYGEDDYQLAVKLDLPLVPMLDDQGNYLDFVTPLQGVYYLKAQKWIIEDLITRGLMFKADRVIHSVAHCYRCDTKLYYNAVPAWFIDIKKLKPELTAQNEHINWYPNHLKHGRFGKGLETAPDWNISRSRYWGTPMPIWMDKATGQKRVIGSIDELKHWAVDPSLVNDSDIHREYTDLIEVWVDDAKTIKGRRIPEVFDCWVESGSMPYASVHYPFENKQKFDASYPAQYIVEYIAQTRAWFYTLHVMSVALFGQHAFENAVTTGTILAEDGTKMSKSKKNFPDPVAVIEQYGADALRFYLMGSVVMKADNLNFSELEVKEVYQKLINILWNTFTFYKLYCPIHPVAVPKPKHVLDRWLVSRTHQLIADITSTLDNYDTITACRLIQDHVSDLSTWYLRRSRDRFKEDPTSAGIFGWALNQLVLLMAPITPFIAESIYQNMGSGVESVHLQSWPQPDTSFIDSLLEEQMKTIRQVVQSIHQQRQQAGIKLRQPLALAEVTLYTNAPIDFSQDLMDLLKDEVNVKDITFKHLDRPEDAASALEVVIDTNITPALQAEGEARELVRLIQGQRKTLGVSIDASIHTVLPDWPRGYTNYIKQKTLSVSLEKGPKLQVSLATD